MLDRANAALSELHKAVPSGWFNTISAWRRTSLRVVVSRGFCCRRMSGIGSGRIIGVVVIDAVEQMDVSAFYAAYRADGHGRAAYEPSLMVAVILFAFATGVRSSRAIERHCREHVAFRVITGNLVPDHVTVARFICRHGQALSGLFTDVLKLCHQAGLVKPGVVSIDGARIAGSANPDVNLELEQIAKEIVAQTKATDEAEDAQFGEARGDELPEELRTLEGRRQFLRRARRSLRRDEEGERPERIEAPDVEAETDVEGETEVEAELEAPDVETEEPERTPTPEFEFDAERITDAGGGRRRWLSEAKRQLEQHRWENPDPIVRSRVERLLWRSGAWRPICRPSGRATKRMRPIASRDGCGTAGGSVARPTRISRRRFPRAR